MIFEGQVIGGLQQARVLGYPTANIDAAVELESGVYASWVIIEGQRFGAALMVGGDFQNLPTPKVEVHILDFPKKDLYGLTIQVEALEKVSHMQSLSNQKELLKKIRNDLDKMRKILNTKY